MGVLNGSLARRRATVGVVAFSLAVVAFAWASPQRTVGESADARPASPHASSEAPGLLAEGVRLSEKPADRSASTSRRGRRTMSESELDEALALLERVKPELADQLASLRAEDARRAGRLVQQRFPRVRYLLRLKEADPALYELRVDELALTYQGRSLAGEYLEARAADDNELAEAVRDELSVLLAEQFEVRQQIRRRKLEKLERRIAELREQIEARSTERDTLIGQRLDELLERVDAASDGRADDER